MSINKKLKNLKTSKPVLFQILVAASIIAAALIIFAVMTATKKDVRRHTLTMAVPVVETIFIKTDSVTVIITGEGTVEPLRQISLSPQVGGKIISISDSFISGGQFTLGDTLLRIDPADYKLALRSSQARVKDLESKLMIAEEESKIAIEEWKIISSENSGSCEPPPLAAKKPQLLAARAALDGAKASTETALLNLERTVITAPFDGRVISKNIGQSQYVSPGFQLGHIYSIEAAEIAVPLPQEDLEWFNVPGFTSALSDQVNAIVTASIAGRELSWPAKIMRAEGVIDQKTRMIKIIVRVPRPYDTRPPLVMGLFVTVEIRGKKLPEAVLIPRIALHQNDTVWIAEDGKLKLRKVETARFEGSNVLIRSGLNNNDQVITSSLKIVTNGMKIRVKQGKGPRNQ